MTISEHITTFAGLPVREFSSRGFVVRDEAAGFELDETHPLEMPTPCAVRINGEAMLGGSAEGLGCCLGPILGMVVFVVGWFVLDGVFEAIGAGVATALVIFIPWTIIDERRRRARMREFREQLEREVGELTALGDNRDETIQLLVSMDSLTAFSVARLIHSGLAATTRALIISTEQQGQDFSELAEILIAASPYFPELRALFLNELTQDECEISWIINGDCTPILQHYPHIERFQIRGGDVRFIDWKLHYLKTLIVETGGLSHEAVQDLERADLPNLEHLELWTGQEEFGSSCEAEHIIHLLESRRWEYLRHLGIRNCEFADDVILWLTRSPLIEQLKTLDFSLGCVSDRGAEALLNCAAVRELQAVDLHYHYISEPLVQQLRTLPLDINLDEPQEPEDVDGGEPLRFSAVGE